MSLSAVYMIIMSILVVVFIVNSIRHRNEIRNYVKYGILFTLILFVFDFAVIILIPNAFELVSVYLWFIVAVFAYVKIVVFTCLGIYYCSLLGIVEIPLTKRFSGISNSFDTIKKQNCITSIFGVVVGAILFTVILFELTSPDISDTLRKLLKTEQAKFGISNEPSVLIALIMVVAAFGEEIIFRLGIQNYLAKQFKLNEDKYWVSVVLTSVLWSIAHANTLDPEWVKIVQIFPMGIVLGFLFKKYGLESCILAHGIFNLCMMFIGPHLITM